MPPFVIAITLVLFATSTQSQYNLIHTNPRCYTHDLCMYASPGSNYSIHPNAEERAHHILHNIARGFTDAFITSKFGAYEYGTYGNTTTIAANCGQIAAGARNLKYTTWFHPLLNEMARFAHYDAYIMSNGTSFFTSTNFQSQCLGFLGANATLTCASTPPLVFAWHGNDGYEQDNTCAPVFDDTMLYHAVGYWPQMPLNRMIRSYLRSSLHTLHASIEDAYPIVMAAHFDERQKVHPTQWNAQGQHFVFMLEYFDIHLVEYAGTVWLVYNRNLYAMTSMFSEVVAQSNTGNPTHSVFISSQFMPTQCRPYAFLVQIAGTEKWLRLPQDDGFYFGTATFYSSDDEDAAGGGRVECGENHYWRNTTSQQWMANASPQMEDMEHNLTTQQQQLPRCVGCAECEALSRIEDILTGDVDVEGSGNDSNSLSLDDERSNLMLGVQLSFDDDSLNMSVTANESLYLISNAIRENVTLPEILRISFAFDKFEASLQTTLNLSFYAEEETAFAEFVNTGEFSDAVKLEFELFYELNVSNVSVQIWRWSDDADADGDGDEEDEANPQRAYFMLIAIVCSSVTVVLCLVVAYILVTQTNDSVSPATASKTQMLNFGGGGGDGTPTEFDSESQPKITVELHRTGARTNDGKRYEYVVQHGNLNSTPLELADPRDDIEFSSSESLNTDTDFDHEFQLREGAGLSTIADVDNEEDEAEKEQFAVAETPISPLIENRWECTSCRCASNTEYDKTCIFCKRPRFTDSTSGVDDVKRDEVVHGNGGGDEKESMPKQQNKSPKKQLQLPKTEETNDKKKTTNGKSQKKQSGVVSAHSKKKKTSSSKKEKISMKLQKIQSESESVQTRTKQENSEKSHSVSSIIQSKKPNNKNRASKKKLEKIHSDSVTIQPKREKKTDAKAKTVKLQKTHSDSGNVRSKKQKSAKTVNATAATPNSTNKNGKKRHNSGPMPKLRSGQGSNKKEDVEENKPKPKTKKKSKLKKVKENTECAVSNNEKKTKTETSVAADKPKLRKSSDKHLSPTVEPQISPLDPPRSPKSPKATRVRK